MREIDDVEHAEDDGKPEAQQRVERAVDQPEQELPEQRLRRNAEDFEHAVGLCTSGCTLRRDVSPSSQDATSRSPHSSDRGPTRSLASGASDDSGSAADQRAVAFLERTERLVRRDRGAQLVDSPTDPSIPPASSPRTDTVGWILRPSARIVPLPNSLSSVGVSFIFATTALPSASLLSSLDRLQIMRDGRIDAGMDHGRDGCPCSAARTFLANSRLASFRSQYQDSVKIRPCAVCRPSACTSVMKTSSAGKILAALRRCRIRRPA